MTAGRKPEKAAQASNKNETQRFDIDEQSQGRIDKALSALCAGLSRARIQSLIESGHVRLGGQICRTVSKKVLAGDRIEIDIPPPENARPDAQDITLDIVYEDDDLLVINKPAGLVVHPGAGNPSGTLVNALLHHCRESLSGIGGVLRPGIVHRLDKDTSGLMVVAKNDRAHQGLSAQLEDRSLSRLYQALVLGVPVPRKGTVDRPVGRHAGSRVKMAVNPKSGRPAKTHYKVLEDFGGACALLECRLESGRTHQIRVHMASIKHPLIGDRLYGPQPTSLRAALKKAAYEAGAAARIMEFPRQALHAGEISFIHPVSEEYLSFTAAPPGDFARLLKLLRK